MKLPVFIGFTVLAAAAFPQSAIIPASTGHGNPTFNCATGDTYGDMDNNLVWICKTPNSWVPTPAFQPFGQVAAGGASLTTATQQNFTGPLAIPDAVLNGPRVDPRYYGAKNDGTTDNCTALTNASAYAATLTNGVLYIPNGTFATSCTVPFTTNWIVDGTLQAMAGGTAASTALVSTGTTAVPNHVGIYGNGTLSGSGLSPIVVWVMQGKHVDINVRRIIGQGVNSIGVEFGDDAGTGGGGVEGDVYHVSFGVYTPSTNPTHTNSTCVYISGGNGTRGQFTDNDISHNLLHGCTTGVVDKTGQNNNFTDDHMWDEVGTTCFDEFAIGGTFLNEYCDSPATYGFHVRNTGTRIIGGIAFYNNTGDNVATAIQFDNSAEPLAYVSGIRIYGVSASHRWASDTNLGFNATGTTWCNVRDESNVVLVPQGTGTCVRNGTQKLFGTIWLSGGIIAGNIGALACSAVCNFAGGGNWIKATLTQNATSTFTVTTPGGGVPYANFTLLICQPAVGGPFTFTPPANSVGFGTIGTTAGKCSVQEFVWDNTTLRALTPMQINE